MKALRIVVLSLALALPAGAQQQIICQPGAPGQTICTQQPRPSGARIAIVAGVAVAGAVIVYTIHRHKRHHK